MEIIAAYLLCVENKVEPTKDMIVKLISTVSQEVNKESVELFMSKIAGKTHDEIIAAGASKMVSAAPAAGSAPAGEKAVEKAAEVVEEESEEDLDLF